MRAAETAKVSFMKGYQTTQIIFLQEGSEPKVPALIALHSITACTRIIQVDFEK